MKKKSLAVLLIIIISTLYYFWIRTVSFQLVDQATQKPLVNKQVSLYSDRVMSHVDWDNPPSFLHLGSYVTDDKGRFSVSVGRLATHTLVIVDKDANQSESFIYSSLPSSLSLSEEHKGNVRLVKRKEDGRGSILGNYIYNLNKNTVTYIALEGNTQVKNFEDIVIEVWISKDLPDPNSKRIVKPPLRSQSYSN